MKASKKTAPNPVQHKHIAKWGFGMAPISPRMRARYDRAVQSLLDVVDGRVDPSDIDPNDISELKGMFNRCIRQDQWDWFSVYSEFGRPPISSLSKRVKELDDLRKSIVQRDTDSSEALAGTLKSAGILKQILARYGSEGKQGEPDSDSEWIYILSTREQPNYLKIGMTLRNVEERVKEINSATGVLFPYSARAVFPVTDAKLAERKVFERLKTFRIRNDREFFEIPFREAEYVVRRTLREEKLMKRSVGTLIWFSQEKGYGFIETDTGPDIFLHFSEVGAEQGANLTKGAQIEFDIRARGQGLSAVDIQLVEPTAPITRQT